ncbi:MAG: DUF4349 domain-containing protein [Chloroflexi bacterium]|nr:DUF4349 domain-containing protein [Chloroflexota bacterium]
MDESTDRPTTLILAGLLMGGTLLLGSVFFGGQSSKILSTVGAAIDTPGSGGDSGSSDGTDPEVTARPAATGAGKGADAAALPPPVLLIVRTGTIDIGIADLDGAVRAADAAVARSGGYVDGSSRTAGGDDPDAVVTYRIPSSTWDTTLDGIRRLASTIHGEQITTEEVSGQVVDLGARIANLRTTEAALQAIMVKATQIKDVLDVQSQLTSTRGEIERLVADKENLEDRAAFGSLTVSFRLPATIEPTPTPVASPGWNPGQDVAEASDKLVTIGQGTTSLGIWLAIVGLPLLIAGTVLAFVTLQLGRLARWILARREPVPDRLG